MNVLRPSPENIKAAARIIQRGGTVVMPTETVYGLACNALDEEAVAKVFALKGRPDDNPMIVHIADLDGLDQIARNVPAVVRVLAERFWPGPLTMVLEKAEHVPYRTTGGLDTVAVRIPDHPVALALIRECGLPLAAPSANAFTKLSPTSAKDVAPEIAEGAGMVLDGGQCQVGLESTVLDLAGEQVQILRPGGVSRAEVQAVLGMPLGIVPPPSVRKSPGLYRRHYAPRATVKLTDRMRAGEPGLVFGASGGPSQVSMPSEPAAYAANLYSALKRLDDQGHDEIWVELPPETQEWEAVRDRLRKASSR
ncbi:MAG: threonylcarbamoyl-AMP synthase [Armatimonadetes bacterium]|nr:threonylcarbamoyl-AMP synthase [Armatimonadota bacterium]